MAGVWTGSGNLQKGSRYFAAISNQTGVASVLQHNFWSRQDKNTNRVSFESLDIDQKSLGC